MPFSSSDFIALAASAYNEYVCQTYLFFQAPVQMIHWVGMLHNLMK